MLGGFLVILGFIVILMVHEGGHLVSAKLLGIKATQYFLGFGPTIWSITKNGTEYGVKAIPAGGYVRIIGMNDLENVDTIDEHATYRSRPFWQKSLVVMSGIGTHFVLAFIILWSASVIIGVPDTNKPSLEIARIIPLDDEGYPTAAKSVHMMPGDTILAVNGSSISQWSELANTLLQNPGQSISITLSRNDEIVNLDAVLGTKKDDASGEDVGFLGIRPKFHKKRENPVLAIISSFKNTVTLTKLSALGIWEFATNFNRFVDAVINNDPELNEIRPVSVIGITQFAVASQQSGIFFTFNLIAYISIFIGIVNAIPLYPFDGGHFAVALYEKITSKKLDIRKLMPIGFLFFSLVVLINIVGIYYDIVNPIDLT